jgi:hypothetical protein
MQHVTHWRRRALAACLSVVPFSVLAHGDQPIPVIGEAECIALANLTKFPEYPTRITLTQWVTNGVANGVALPPHCRVQGIAQERTGVRGIPYGIKFEVRLPAQWNGRFMFQGAGGTQGTLGAATGGAGTASPTLAKGFVVASENGGHDNATLSPMGNIIAGNMFYDDPQAVKDWAYNSADVTTRTAKFLIEALYDRKPRYSYFVGCSTSGRQGMAMSQLFPKHFDGIVAGDPFFVPPMISMSETWAVQQVRSVSPVDPVTGAPIYHQSYSVADRELFTRALMESCDALDGLADGVIDNRAACRFDPAKFKFAATGKPLQCAGAKEADCLSQAQVTAIKNMARGPRTSWGAKVYAPDGTLVTGYPYDGGWMEPSGIPARNIGTPTSPPGNLSLGTAQLTLFWFKTPDPTANPVDFDWDRDVSLVVKRSPAVNNDTHIEDFRRQGGKIIWYHGLSDSGPPYTYTAEYFDNVAKRSPREGRDFMRLYLIPNMGHCSGGPSTDRFDFLTPLMNWVENGDAPEEIVATGTAFKTAPTTRSRPLCVYPKVARYSGPAGGDIGLAENYRCVPGPRYSDEDDDRGRGHRRHDDDHDGHGRD